MELDAEIEPGSGGYVTEGEPCMECDRTGQAPDGMARLQHDVVTLPADQQALGLVEAILEQSRVVPSETVWSAATQEHLLVDLGIIQGLAERLKVLLKKQPALLETLREAVPIIRSHHEVTRRGDEASCEQSCAVRDFIDRAQAAIEAAS
jgi:hypothetical protein